MAIKTHKKDNGQCTINLNNDKLNNGDTTNITSMNDYHWEQQQDLLFMKQKSYKHQCNQHIMTALW